MSTEYENYLAGKLREMSGEHGPTFDASSLDAAGQFKPYFRGPRVKVTTTYGNPDNEVPMAGLGQSYTRTGRVSVTTGRRPAFILVSRSNAYGSGDVLGSGDKIVGVQRRAGGPYVPPPPGQDQDQPYLKGMAEIRPAAMDDDAGPPFVAGTAPDYVKAVGIATSDRTTRVLGNTGGKYRYGRFYLRDDGAVTVTMMGRYIAEFKPLSVRLWTRGYHTLSTVQALNALVTGGYFYTEKRVIYFRSYVAGTGTFADEPLAEGQGFPYVTYDSAGMAVT